jgi:hypothetical protein
VSSRFNTYLRGLLGMLDAKVEGKAPSSFEDTVRVTLDALPFFYAQKRVIVIDDTDSVVSASGWWPCTSLQVPPEEVWYIEHAAVSFGTAIPLPAGAVINASPAYQLRTGALGLLTEIALPTVPFAYGTNTVPQFASMRPFVLAPGDRLGVWAHFVAGAPGAGVLRMTYIPMPV